MSTKKELRNQYKTLRSQLSEAKIEAQSLKIANQLLQLPVWDKTYFHIFLPMAAQKEVNTEFILHLLAGKDKEIILSRSDFQTRDMAHFLLTDSTKIVQTSYGIPEPVAGIEVSTAKIQVVFVPLLAYDQTGHRVGYGKGFYDKFLGACPPETLKIGLSFFAPEERISDVFQEDVRLDYCVTPDKIWDFKT